MNAEQIRQMEAGRELDALVVTHVFDLVWWRRGKGGQWIALPEHDTEIPDYWIRDVPTALTEDDLSEAVSHYSTDIAAAWEVHLAMFAQGPLIKARYLHELADILLERYSGGPTSLWLAPIEFFDVLAICRAALLAMMRES